MGYSGLAVATANERNEIMSNIACSPIVLTVTTIILTNVLTNVVTRWPVLFKGFDSDIINGLATLAASSLIIWAAAWIHGKNTAAQVAKATGTGDGGKP